MAENSQDLNEPALLILNCFVSCKIDLSGSSQITLGELQNIQYGTTNEARVPKILLNCSSLRTTKQLTYTF